MSTCDPHMPDASATGTPTSESRIEQNRTEYGLTENLQDQGDSLTSVDAHAHGHETSHPEDCGIDPDMFLNLLSTDTLGCRFYIHPRHRCWHLWRERFHLTRHGKHCARCCDNERIW